MDRLTEMEAFANVVDQGGFTDAAKKMGISKSAVSKHVSSLEARLGARLLNRTTRRVSPTEIGLAYYDRARRVLNDAGEADALVTSMQSAPSGLLRISVATDFGVNHLSPVLSEFLSEFPEITVNMVLNNRYVELISEGFDMAVRIGELEDSTLRARKLTETTKAMIASPSYFEKYGYPQKIDDLNEHKLLHYSNQSSGNVWKLTAPSGEKRQVRTAGWLSVNDGQSLLNAALPSPRSAPSSTSSSTPLPTRAPTTGNPFHVASLATHCPASPDAGLFHAARCVTQFIDAVPRARFECPQISVSAFGVPSTGVVRCDREPVSRFFRWPGKKLSTEARKLAVYCAGCWRGKAWKHG